VNVVYSREQVRGLPSGAKYANPRNFEAPVEGATKVYLRGDWPAIREAYEKLKVPVADFSELKLEKKDEARGGSQK
jgi:hypothetical protein